jgi:hypothetical protein
VRDYARILAFALMLGVAVYWLGAWVGSGA